MGSEIERRIPGTYKGNCFPEFDNVVFIIVHPVWLNNRSRSTDFHSIISWYRGTIIPFAVLCFSM